MGQRPQKGSGLLKDHLEEKGRVGGRKRGPWNRIGEGAGRVEFVLGQLCLTKRFECVDVSK